MRTDMRRDLYCVKVTCCLVKRHTNWQPTIIFASSILTWVLGGLRKRIELKGDYNSHWYSSVDCEGNCNSSNGYWIPFVNLHHFISHSEFLMKILIPFVKDYRQPTWQHTSVGSLRTRPGSWGRWGGGSGCPPAGPPYQARPSNGRQFSSPHQSSIQTSRKKSRKRN